MTQPRNDLVAELKHRADMAVMRGVTGGKTEPKDHDKGAHAWGSLASAGAGGEIAKAMPKNMSWPGGSEDIGNSSLVAELNARAQDAEFRESDHPRDNGGKFGSGGSGGIGPSAAEKIKNAATMYGTGSKQHKEAIRRFGAAKVGKAKDNQAQLSTSASSGMPRGRWGGRARDQ